MCLCLEEGNAWAERDNSQVSRFAPKNKSARVSFFTIFQHHIIEQSNREVVEPGNVPECNSVVLRVSANSQTMRCWVQTQYNRYWFKIKNNEKYIKTCIVSLTGPCGIPGMPGEVHVNAEKGKKGTPGMPGLCGFPGPRGEKLENFLSLSVCIP